MYKSVFIIGPRLEDTYDKLKSLYDGEENIIIGDGKRRITEEDILSLAGKIDPNTKIIVNCHADCRVKEFSYSQFDIELFRGFWGYNINDKDIEKLWHALSEASNNQPLQINLLGCHIGLAKDSIKCLPLGSVLMMYSPKDDYGWSHNQYKIIKSIMASKHLSNPFEVFLDNILTNLSNCGASIATNAPIGSSHLSFTINSDSLKNELSDYLSTVSHETMRFYNKNKFYFECSSIIFTNSKLAAEKFFQNKKLNEPSLTKDAVDKFAEGIIETKISGKDPNCTALLASVLQEEHKQLKLAHGNSLLHHAVNKGKIDVMEQLIKEGFNINAKNNYGNTPLHLTAMNGQQKVAEFLIQNGADVNAKNNYGNTALHKAIENCNLVVALHLIEKDADVNATNTYGSSVLHWAAKYGKVEVIKVLIQNGADINVKNNGGCTPLHYAAEHGQAVAIDILIEKAANIHAKDNRGYTPIQLAAENGHFDAVKSLLEHGAKNTGFWGWLEWIFCSSPEQIADKKGHIEIAEYIRSYNNGSSTENDNSINHDPALVDGLQEVQDGAL